MKSKLITLIILLGGFMNAYAKVTTSFNEHISSKWRETIFSYARTNLDHTAWGLAHAQRNYLLSLELAKQEGLKVDSDILFAAAFLHDIGAFPKFEKKGIEHSKVAADLVEEIVLPRGFPKSKITALKDVILGHMFYAIPSNRTEAIVFHDADVLDFLGSIGVIRLCSISTRHRFATNLAEAIGTAEKFHKELPDKLITPTAKNIGARRMKEGQLFLKNISKQTYNYFFI